MKKYVLALLWLLFATVAQAQPSQPLIISNGVTPIVGGSTGQCVTKASNGTVSMASCNDGTYSTTQTIIGTSGLSPVWAVKLTGDTDPRAAIGLNSVDGGRIAFGSGSSALDTFFARSGAASFRYGAPDSASPVAQTFTMQGVVAGTTDTAGVTANFRGSPSTGSAAGGGFSFTVTPAGSSGTSQNSQVSRLSLTTTGVVLGGSGSTAVPVGIGGASSAGFSLLISTNITGSVNSRQQRNGGTIQSDVTTLAVYYATNANTAAASFTVPTLRHYTAVQGTIGAGSAITTQYGFSAESTLTGATTNFGFHSNIAAASGRWNFAGAGTAANYFLGPVQLGTATALTMSSGEFGLAKITASATAPGATGVKIAAVCGTNAGTAKLIAYAGTSNTEVTILDNIGSGVSGC